MEYSELYKKYLALLEENKLLKLEINKMAATSGISELEEPVEPIQRTLFNKDKLEKIDFQTNKYLSEDILHGKKAVSKKSSKEEKIVLFMSLFKGRNDVYAKRWENKKGQSGYSPVCSNEWVTGLCLKPKIKCSKCKHKLYSPLNEHVIEQHLLGEIVIGIYPLSVEENCNFLAIDFDKEGWRKDISVVRKICTKFDIPVAVERSMSGNGGHIWFFFKEEMPATLARKFGSSLLTYSMGERHEISFKSYDRLFPNQDTMPKGGLGNLIALPLQKKARNNGNTLFVDKNFEPVRDQWIFIAGVQRITVEELNVYIKKLGKDDELGILKNYDKEIEKPWKERTAKLNSKDFPAEIEIVKSSMLYIRKEGLAQKTLNAIQRLAAFKNPEFYKAQAMRMPTYNKPRIISCSDDFKDYLGLPRGCEEDVKHLFEKYKTKVCQVDKTSYGSPINVEFKGVLWPEQQHAVNALVEFNNGVLSATTAFGKTVIGAKLISIRKVNTLILVHRQQLLSQWKERLKEFLEINEIPQPELQSKRGKTKNLEVIGQLGAGKNQLSCIIDVAIMQSVNSKGEIGDYLKNYGMIIVDECHHVPAFSFEQILRNTPAKYIYGLTATPSRSDGHHPIIFFYCGPVRYLVDAKYMAEKRPFEHILIPRFTSYNVGNIKKDDELTIQDIYSELVNDEIRNSLIADDVVECFKNGRNILVLTGRVAHVKTLTKILSRQIPNIISLTGGMGNKKTLETLAQISTIPKNKPFVLVATGSFIGEGFDEPRLDTLFLTMPIAWKGTLQQYAGRLHRLHEKKTEVQIFDYVDIHVKVLERMYGKRLKGYASIGYKTKAETIPGAPIDIIFDKQSFFPVYLNDIERASTQIQIVSPFITKKRVEQMIPFFIQAIEKNVEITIITRPVIDFAENKRDVLKAVFLVLENSGVHVIFKSKIHQKFAVIDQRISWYGSINLLSFGWSEESIMRIASGNIANELLKSIQ